MDIKNPHRKLGQGAVASTNAVVPTLDEDTLAIGEKDGGPTVDDSLILTGKRLFLAHTGFLLAVFCFSLDQTIVATALPKLASEFNALDQLTWVISVYFCVCHPSSIRTVNAHLIFCSVHRRIDAYIWTTLDCSRCEIYLSQLRRDLRSRLFDLWFSTEYEHSGS